MTVFIKGHKRETYYAILEVQHKVGPLVLPVCLVNRCSLIHGAPFCSPNVPRRGFPVQSLHPLQGATVRPKNVESSCSRIFHFLSSPQCCFRSSNGHRDRHRNRSGQEMRMCECVCVWGGGGGSSGTSYPPFCLYLVSSFVCH